MWVYIYKAQHVHETIDLKLCLATLQLDTLLMWAWLSYSAGRDHTDYNRLVNIVQ